MLLAAWCLRVDVQPDLYFHLALGRRVLGEGLPATNPFLWPHPEHPFVAHEWLFGVVAYALHGLGGGPLLTLAKTAVLAGAAAALVRALTPFGPGLRWAVLVPFVLVAGQRFVLRPEVVSVLGVALHLLALIPTRGRPSRAALVGLPLFQVVWSNVHGFSLLGPVVTGGALAGALLHGALGARGARWGRPGDARALALLLGLELGAALLNPYGPRAAFYPLHLLAQGPAGGALGLEVVEMLSPFDPALGGRPELIVYRAWAAAALPLAGLALWRGRLRPEGLVVAAGLFAASAGWVRNLPFGALGLALPTAAGLAVLGDLARERLGPADWRRLRTAGLAAAAAAALLLTRATLADAFHRNADHDARTGVDLGDFQRFDAAAAHLREEPPRGHLFNNFGAGHFLTWALAGEPRPFVSGNVDLYPPEHLRRYRALLRGQLPFTETLDALGVTCVLLDHRVEVPPDLIARLHADAAWRLTHADERCVVFRRADGASAGAFDLDAFAARAAEASYADEATAELPPLGLLRAVGLLPEGPGRPVLRTHTARLLALLGRPEAALEVARSAHARAPGWLPTRAVLADLERRHGDPARAERHFEALRAAQPGAAGPRLGLGQLALAAGRPRAAAAHFRAAWAAAPPGSEEALLAGTNLLAAWEAAGDPVELRRALAVVTVRRALALFYAGAAAWLEGELDLAEAGFRAALDREPELSLARSRLGEVLFQRGDLAGAEAAYRALTAATPGDGLAWRNLGVVLARQGRPAEAVAAWERGAEADPRETLCLVYAAREHRAAGRVARARARLEEALRREPGHEQAREILDALQD